MRDDDSTKPVIFYGVCGYGKGHACRALSLVEWMKKDYRFILFCPGEAHDYLEPLYRDDPDVEVAPLNPPLEFKHRRNRISVIDTARCALRYLWNVPRMVALVREAMRRRRPVAVISDLEFCVIRAASRENVPVVTISSHSEFVAGDFSDFPWFVRLNCFFISLYVRLVHHHYDRGMISLFCDLKLKKRRLSKFVCVGTVLRPRIFELTPRRGDYLVAYLREAVVTDRVLDILDRCGRPVRFYGLPDGGRRTNIEFKPFGEHFIEDLEGCLAVISTAGVQLVGECFYLNKPLLVMPETRQIEQYVNARLLKECGGGEAVSFAQFSEDVLKRFLENVEAGRYDEALKRLAKVGNDHAASIVRQVIQNRARSTAPTA